MKLGSWIILLIIIILFSFNHLYPRIYLHGLFIQDENSYVKAQKFCSTYKYSIDRDFCRSYITEKYIGQKQH